MCKRILLIGGNYAPELTGIGKYNGEMMQWFAQQGYDCTVITTFPYYPHWKVNDEYSSKQYLYSSEQQQVGKHHIQVIRCPHFVPKQPSGANRLLSDLTIFISTFFAVFIQLFKKKHDYVLVVAPPFLTGLTGIMYQKIKGASLVYHVQDLQIDAARDLNMIKSPAVFKALFGIEKYILNQANMISTISRGMMKRLENKCSKTVTFFPNWVDLDQFYIVKNKEELKFDFGFNCRDKIILYSGAIGEKQGLEAILYAAQSTLHIPNIKYIICGSGPYKQNLEVLKDKLQLTNVFFLPLKPTEKFNSFLNMADFHLILQKSNAGDLVLPSKLSAILATGGVSIVTANPGTSLYDIVVSAEIGYAIEPENQLQLNEVILKAIQADNATKSYNALTYANNSLSLNSILADFERRLLNYGVEKKVHSQFEKEYAE